MVIDDGRTRPRPDDRAGFTLVEVVVALVILAFGLLGLAATSGFVVHQTAIAGATTERAVVQQSAMEEIRARPFAEVSDSSWTLGRYQVSWSVLGSGKDYKTIELVTTGPGLTSAGGGAPRLRENRSDTTTFRIIDLRP